jgi:cell division septal protein FtsQ
MLIYQGRANLYQDFLKYAAEAKRNRDEALEAQKKAKIAKRQRNLAILRSMVIVFICLLGLACVGGFVYWLANMRPA